MTSTEHASVEAPPADAQRRGGVEFVDVSKAFGDVTAVDRLDLTIEPGEFVSILGPSGCGKTTTLRMISGLEAPDAGDVRISGRSVTAAPPHRRAVNTVFQSYALFPHMTVADNVAYGLRVKKVPKRDIPDRVRRALAMVRLTDLADRRPALLSGGQQQRAALARALVNDPDVLLLDEPLSALDLKLRQAMRLQLRELHASLGMTFVFVTHDQEEAITMSDRVAVMSEGRVLQIGTPEDVYERPVSRFVARFVGETNLLDGEASVDGDRLDVRLPTGEVVSAPIAAEVESTPSGISLRPQYVDLVPASVACPTGWSSMTGTLRQLIYLGDATRASVALDDGTDVSAVRHNAEAGSAFGTIRPGDAVRAQWPTEVGRAVGP